jgi:hypothetical protein
VANTQPSNQKKQKEVVDIYNPPLSDKQKLIKDALVNDEETKAPGLLDCELANDPLTW